MTIPSNYQNPLLQTSALSKFFQKGPPKNTCGKCRHSHSHGDCPDWGTTCGKKNHWSQMCRSSRMRHSSSGCTPSLHQSQQQRQRRPSDNKHFKKAKGGGGGSSNQNKKTTPKKPGGGKPKPFKAHFLVVSKNSLSEPSHPPKVKYFNDNEEYSDCNKKYKVCTDTDSDGKTEIITDLISTFKGNAIAMEVKVDPGSKTNCIQVGSA